MATSQPASAESLRAAQAQAARDAALHDEPRLAELLEKIDAMLIPSGEMVALIPEVITPYLTAQVASVNVGLISLRDAVLSAQRQVAAVLAVEA